jgi:hypothetical protein
MNTDYLSPEKIEVYLLKVNQQFGTRFIAKDFSHINNKLGLEASLIEQLSSNQGQEWTAEQANVQIKSALAAVCGKNESSITDETLLDDLIPASGRKESVKKIEEKLGFSIDILKPNNMVYGFFIFLFFLGIPGMFYSWFISGIVMIVCAFLIYILGKTGNEFKVKTVGHLADHLFWNKYLKNASKMQLRSTEEITTKLDAIIGRGY